MIVKQSFVRWMVRIDLEEVVAIEEASFDDPWDEKNFLGCLKQRNNVAMVAEHRGRVVGYIIYELHKALLRIVTIAVHPDFVRKGYGKAMLDRLKGEIVKRANRRKLLAEVPETWLPSQLFLRAQGFRAVKIVRDVYDNGEAAYVMEWSE